MLRRMAFLGAAAAAIGCSATVEDPGQGAANLTVQPEAFTGVWRSVTPQTEFVRLTVSTTSSRPRVLGARLTFSGVALEGSGEIQADSVMLALSSSPLSSHVSVFVLRVRDANTLRLQERPASSGGLDLTLIREP